MSTPLTIHYAIIGTNLLFDVTLSNTQSVNNLKTQIKANHKYRLASCDAATLILYKVKIDTSNSEAFKDVMKDISRGSVFFSGVELDYPFAELREIFQESDIPKRMIHILVRPSASESINSWVCSAVAETVLTPPQLRQSFLSLPEE